MTDSVRTDVIPLEHEIELRVVQAGPPGADRVMLLHGWPGGWFDWRRVIPLLPDLHVIVPDLRGFGGSSKPRVAPEDGYTPEHLAGDLALLVSALGGAPALIVGYDIGATVAQSLARRHHEVVRGLVLCNPAYPGIGDRRHDVDVYPEFWYQQLHRQPWAEQVIGSTRETVSVYIRHFYDHWAGPGLRLSAEEFAEVVDAYASPDALRGCFSYYRARAGGRAAEAPANPDQIRIHAPTHVLWGELDPVIRATWSDRLGEYFNLVSLTTLPRVGHFVPLEAPDACADAISRALAPA